MKKLHQLLDEITRLTTNIETNYPSLYQFLDENPVTIPSDKHPHMDQAIMADYLDSLKKLLHDHLENHKKEKVKL